MTNLMRTLAHAALVATGLCVGALEIGCTSKAAPQDLGTVFDLSVPDAEPRPDLATKPDLKTAVDLAVPPDLAPAVYVPPAGQAGQAWRVLFSDEFNGRPCDPGIAGACPAGSEARIAACYGTGSTAASTNLQHKFHAGGGDTTQSVLPSLLDLDKCVWSVNDHVNWIHFTGPSHTYLIAKYDPSMVEVSGGELRLKTKYVHGVGPCGTNASPEDPTGQNCPYYAGCVTTIPFHGLSAAFPKSTGPYQPGDGLSMPPSGRLEIRAKMPYENGNMAALWTWAVGNGWEHEHDILEYWVNWREAHHEGDVQWHGSDASNKGAWIVSSNGNDDRYTEFHVYGVEWEEGQFIRYLLDGVEVARYTQGEPTYSQQGVCYAAEVNGNPFYLILWNLMMAYDYAPSAAPIGAGQAPDWLHIDWVRLYERCTRGAPGCDVDTPTAGVCPSPCGGYGTWDGTRCVVGEVPMPLLPGILGGQFAYYGDITCSHGGTLGGGGCVLGAPPAGRTPFIDGQKFGVNAMCSPLDGIFNCSRPCPAGATVTSTGCLTGGTTTPTERCAYGGTWDAAEGACLFFTAPAGRTAFTWEDGYYYSKAAGPPYCNAGATYDGANCYVGPRPPGADLYASGARLWLRKTCAQLPSPTDFFSSLDVNPDVHTCP